MLNRFVAYPKLGETNKLIFKDHMMEAAKAHHEAIANTNDAGELLTNA
jgi:hypothetical protein